MRDLSRTCLTTHKGCLDGSGSAFVFFLAGGPLKNVIYKTPKDCALTPDEAAPYDEVWFVDLCPWDLRDPAGGKPWRVVDHHLTNIKRHGTEVPNVNFGIGCGTSLLAQELLGYPNTVIPGCCGYSGQNDCVCGECAVVHTQVNRVVKAIEDHDLGRFENEDGLFLATLASMYDQADIVEMLGGDPFSCYHEEVHGARLVMIQNIRTIVDRAYTDVFDNGLTAAFACAPKDWKSAVGEALLRREGVDIAVILDPSGGMVSLRSRPGGPDVSAVAERYGGGGHRHSAAFAVPRGSLHESIFRAVFE